LISLVNDPMQQEEVLDRAVEVKIFQILIKKLMRFLTK